MGACFSDESYLEAKPCDDGKGDLPDCLDKFLSQKKHSSDTMDKIRAICTKFQSFSEDSTLRELRLSPESDPFVRLIAYILAMAHGVLCNTLDENEQMSVIFTKQSSEKAKEIKEMINKINNLFDSLQSFNNNSSLQELIFSHELCPFERFVIHEIAKNYGMTSFSTGEEEEERYVTVQKTP
jgi:hypothetical protein